SRRPRESRRRRSRSTRTTLVCLRRTPECRPTDRRSKPGRSPNAPDRRQSLPTATPLREAEVSTEEPCRRRCPPESPDRPRSSSPPRSSRRGKERGPRRPDPGRRRFESGSVPRRPPVAVRFRCRRRIDKQIHAGEILTRVHEVTQGRATRRPIGRHPLTSAENMSSKYELTHLQALESESIHIIREAVAESERPVLLFSGGKDSACVLHLAVKAFWPARLPFPIMHVDTGHNFPEVIE